MQTIKFTLPDGLTVEDFYKSVAEKNNYEPKIKVLKVFREDFKSRAEAKKRQKELELSECSSLDLNSISDIFTVTYSKHIEEDNISIVEFGKNKFEELLRKEFAEIQKFAKTKTKRDKLKKIQEDISKAEKSVEESKESFKIN